MSGNCDIKEADDFTTDASESQATLEEMRKLYEEQQLRLACPTCGEEPFRG